MPWVPKKYQRDKPRLLPTSSGRRVYGRHVLPSPEEIEREKAIRFAVRYAQVSERYGLDTFDFVEQFLVRRDWYLIEVQQTALGNPKKRAQLTDSWLEALEDRIAKQVCRDMRHKRTVQRTKAIQPFWTQDPSGELSTAYRESYRKVYLETNLDDRDALRRSDDFEEDESPTEHRAIFRQWSASTFWEDALQAIRDETIFSILTDSERDIVRAKYRLDSVCPETDHMKPLPDREVGRLLNMPIRTVNYHLHAALRKLREHLCTD